MKWLVAEFQHETNTFSNILPGHDEFQSRELLLGPQIARHFRGTRSSLGGFIDFTAQHDIDVVWTIAAFTTPAGRIQAGFYDWAKAQIIAGLTEKVDGVLLSLHGAMCAEGVDDGDAQVLAEIRRRIGKDVPIAASLDFHANVGAGMIAQADILVGYKTYPHVDTYEAAIHAADLLLKTSRGKVRPRMWMDRPPILSPLGNTATARQPMLSIMQRAAQIERQPGVLAASVFGGFPYADVADAGMAVLVVTDGDKAPGAKYAKELSDMLWSRRQALLHEATPVDAAVRKAIDAPRGPVVLADISDNPGGGGAADGVEILRELLKQGATATAVGPVWDPPAVLSCRAAGINNDVTIDLGGHTDSHHGKSVKLAGKVVRLPDGSFVFRGPMNTGVASSLGPCAVVRSGGVDVLISTSRMQNIDPEMFRCAGIEPAKLKIVVVKSSIHYRAAYESIAARIIEVDAPGLVAPNLKRFDFRKVRRPIFPLDAI
jgi:microcystin degradation protein MlrC